MLRSIEGNFDNYQVHELLIKHFIELRSVSPKGSAHVLDINGLKDPSIKFWSLWENDELMGSGAIKFIDKNNNLYVNEIAPRVHNSGHLTINAYNISQFENHIRAVCQLEQIPLKKISNAKMINIIGEQISIYRNKKFESNEFFFDYLKKEIKHKRKMGHLTTLTS